MELASTCMTGDSMYKIMEKEHFQKTNIPEEVTWKSNTIHISEGHDPLSKLHTIMHGDTLPLAQGKEVLIDRTCEHFQNLNICASKTESVVNDRKIVYPAGKIDKIITSLSRLIIQPLSTDKLLCLGSPLFLERFDTQGSETRNYLLGHIDDIFGSIHNPLYSVDIEHKATDDTMKPVRHEIRIKQF
ncbi:hypothetical protein KM043_014191 [Ampulex compressa]|nr:hypothetical protein KM043_014191 [Ampulex compressa]